MCTYKRNNWTTKAILTTSSHQEARFTKQQHPSNYTTALLVTTCMDNKQAFSTTHMNSQTTKKYKDYWGHLEDTK